MVFGRAAFGITLGDFTELVTLHHTIAKIFGLFLHRFNFFGALAFGAQENLRKLHLLGSRKFLRMLVVIFLHFFIANVDARADFLAHHFLRKQAIATLDLIVLPGDSLPLLSLLHLFQAVQSVLL